MLIDGPAMLTLDHPFLCRWTYSLLFNFSRSMFGYFPNQFFLCIVLAVFICSSSKAMEMSVKNDYGMNHGDIVMND